MEQKKYPLTGMERWERLRANRRLWREVIGGALMLAATQIPGWLRHVRFLPGGEALPGLAQIQYALDSILWACFLFYLVWCLVHREK